VCLTENIYYRLRAWQPAAANPPVDGVSSRVQRRAPFVLHPLLQFVRC